MAAAAETASTEAAIAVGMTSTSGVAEEQQDYDQLLATVQGQQLDIAGLRRGGSVSICFWRERFFCYAGPIP